MSEFEVIVLISSLSLTVLFFYQWFRPFFKIWPATRIRFASNYFLILPCLALIILIITVRKLASFDVVTSGGYQFFYILLGFAWIYVTMILVSFFLDLSWKDDIFHINNKASMPAIAGAFIAVTLIYAGANIGDGPGWWCVIVSGGIGLMIFFIIVRLIHRITRVLELILVGRNKDAGIRMGLFFVASGILIGRGSGGDWISLNQTIMDFWVVWPLLVIGVIVIIIEFIFRASQNKFSSTPLSFLLGLIYVGLAITAVLYLPGFVENPAYSLFVKGSYL